MVIIESRRGPFRYRLVFFPNDVEVENIAATVTSNTVVRIRQTKGDLGTSGQVLGKRLFRTSCIDLTTSQERLFSEMHRTCRTHVRRAERMLDRIEVRRNDDRAAGDFLYINNEFVRRRGSGRPLSMRRFRQFSAASDVWMLYLDGTPMVGRMDIVDRSTGRVRMTHSATRRLEGVEEAKMTAPLNRYLHWFELRHYKAQGLSLYDFGGVGDEQNPLTRFKQSFGGFLVDEYCYVLARWPASFALRLFGPREW